MFSNGTEYLSFLEVNCDQCPHFVHYEDATDENPECPIEQSIALVDIDPGMTAPMEWLDANGYMHRYDCRRKAGLEKKPLTDQSQVYGNDCPRGVCE